jgi:hypothetical protein
LAGLYKPVEGLGFSQKDGDRLINNRVVGLKELPAYFGLKNSN